MPAYSTTTDDSRSSPKISHTPCWGRTPVVPMAEEGDDSILLPAEDTAAGSAVGDVSLPVALAGGESLSFLCLFVVVVFAVATEPPSQVRQRTVVACP
mmetsp:Transcript_5898/g.12087  ORF Transcript_5898/g.12087 Transcript_5898/m.12087 type:complete len:98 (+) Transcript_5898:187-480(+)